MKLYEFAGGDPLVMTLAGLDVASGAIGPVTIFRGRRTADVRPGPSVLSASLRASLLPALPELGDAVTVDLGPDMLAALGDPAGVSRRFTGTVTDAAIRPTTDIVTIMAAGPRSRAARVPIGDTPWPAELDGVRADRIFAALLAADPTFVIGPTDPGVVTVLARDVDARPAAELLDELAAHTGGDAWETREGALIWTDARGREDELPSLTLVAGNVLVDPEFSKNLDGLVTHLTVGYGLPVFDPGDGSTTQALVVMVDETAPITALAARVSTQIASEDDALAYATEVVGRRSRPRWRVPALAVDVLRTLDDPDQRAALLALDSGSLVALSGMPTLLPFTASQLWVEGVREEYTVTNWRVTLSVSPRGLTGPQNRWADIPTTYPAPTELDPNNREPMTWDAPAFAGLSWLAVTGWWTEEVVDLGRWVDVPANRLWSEYHPTITWAELP
jgi:hypothetical protein